MRPSVESVPAWELGARYFEAWNAHDPDAIVALVHEEVEWHDPAMSEPARGRPAVRAFAGLTFRAFPDLRFSMSGDEGASRFTSADGSRFAVGWTARGSFLGPIDPPGFAPTGRGFVVDGIDVVEISDGLLYRDRSYYDLTDWMRQIGLFPGRGGGAERLLVGLQRIRARVVPRPRI